MHQNNEKIVLFDLDETIIFSEGIKTKAWDSILYPWGFCWSQEETNVELQYVPEEKRPKTGLSPHDFIESLIDNLQLLKLNKPSMSTNDDHYSQTLLELNQNKLKKENMIAIMQQEWTRNLIMEVKAQAEQGKIEEVPGAVDAMKRLHQANFQIGVVTQAPYQYAIEILKSLSLISANGKNLIEALVSGEMVKNPKPNPETLLVATGLIINDIQLPDQPQIIITKSQEIINSARHNLSVLKAIIGDSQSDMEAGKILNIKRILINSRKLSFNEIKALNPDIILNSYSELKPNMITFS